ncbi:MAG TPA: S-methyl-5'-thioinosine phosphorylase [Solirubrobacterales bacterium]|nr:S-methyl-5'-thioinosine phosphorylase [Solirubrobacterales bacterium]HMX72084.1 S-methyl-5'-thioinosine phosphorylase [Solirubrobacterales bacterium]HNA25096.1 S-methyl-5'-thioinosine phosphorylase [Solirubrobacterales bacterium]HNA43981.1 S-methyl-5'-thioinosine phosphorylase [Solirubrobacterales bacterium]HNC93323.1 S-methyl-5'-thioinosine phosphorylase [Solirubrobacterales bacterium]
MGLLGVIGGSGLYGLSASGRPKAVSTPWGPASGPTVIHEVGGGVAFIARHGADHSIAPHRVNYRANIHALREAGCDRVLAVSSVGGIAPACQPGKLVVPDQLIDYTWGREMTFQGEGDAVRHFDFTDPYSPDWRGKVTGALSELEIEFVDGGTYAAVQGPRFETAAEIRRLAADGCHIVGMTGMPEAILAREAGLDYAAVCPVGNLAAGIATDELSMDDVIGAVGTGMERVTSLITNLA